MVLDYKRYGEKARELCAESCVLVKNTGVLPLKEESILSVFGRTQLETYYCGTGSGGKVNLPYVVHLTKALGEQRKINQDLVQVYEDYIGKNPFDKGAGWAQEPWSQKELPLTEELVANARKSSAVAVMIIGRSAGEDKDAAAQEGSYYLTQVEKSNMKLICQHFDEVVVLLNVGNVIETDFSAYGDPSAVLYAWHGGCESGNGYSDVLCGKVNPCGSLPDTIGISLEANSSSAYFGGKEENIYVEDIFVGYRYSETFAPETVLYPFGFGLSYTTFALEPVEFQNMTGKIKITNTGSVSGKKAVQVYVEAAQGKLGKAKRVLVGFAKSKVLAKGESQILEITVEEDYFTSYDEEISAFVLEKGEYHFVVGFDVRNCETLGRISYHETKIVSQCRQAMAPVKAFSHMAMDEKGQQTMVPVKNRSYDIGERIAQEEEQAPAQTNHGYHFKDVLSGKITPRAMAEELSDLELIHLSRGEGMCSPKVTAGTAGCFGGLTTSLKERGIPIGCCADGPSGIRMDSGTMAFSIPNGTAIASTFDLDLTRELFVFLGLELAYHNIDTILGPGMNIHRNPLCGRNFEYFSEDPFLTGKMAVAELEGLHVNGVTGTIKHFIGNNQENGRRVVNTVASERALREIYLKGFEIAVKEGNAYFIMTAYNPINGIQAASNFDLTSQILRKEWGYEGVVMTDWWAEMNVEGGKPASRDQTSAMIIAQNEIYMVNKDGETNSNEDDSEISLGNGTLSRFVLLRNGTNMMATLLRCHRENEEITRANIPEEQGKTHYDSGTFTITSEKLEIPCQQVRTEVGSLNHFTFMVPEPGKYQVTFDLEAIATELAQVPMTILVNRTHIDTFTLRGQTRETCSTVFHVMTNINTFFDLFFGESGMKIHSFTIEQLK
ncbi:MAG: glycoside hydrolase family 3 N-terminal domain-containing protein [Eubacteriales bacterium]